MPTLLWMECGACSGESMAILGAEGPGMGWILSEAPLELDAYNRPSTVGPCLTNGIKKKCGTA